MTTPSSIIKCEALDHQMPRETIAVKVLHLDEESSSRLVIVQTERRRCVATVNLRTMPIPRDRAVLVNHEYGVLIMLEGNVPVFGPGHHRDSGNLRRDSGYINGHHHRGNNSSREARRLIRSRCREVPRAKGRTRPRMKRTGSVKLTRRDGTMRKEASHVNSDAFVGK